jgi:hypothetical protein
MSCEQFAENVSDLLEREVSEPTRAGMERHALECDECGALLADLRKLRIDAANLPALTPSRDLWSGIAARIDAPVIPLPSAHRVAEDTRLLTSPRWRWVRYAAAAAVLIAATATTTYYVATAGQGDVQRVAAATGAAPQAAPAGVDSSPAITPSVVAAVVDSGRTITSVPAEKTTEPAIAGARAQLTSSRITAEQVYGNEIARLRSLVERRRSQLDPVTISVIERNLRVIDEAITQCRAALAKDPASRFLMESLNNALETKVELLRTAAMLPPRA